MCWLKRDIWKAGIAIAGMLLLVLMVWVPVSAAGAYEGASELATPITGPVQATPTEDATVTALNKEKLAQDVAQQQHTLENWFWNNGAALVSSLALVLAGAFTLLRYLRDQRNEREKQRDDRQTEREKRAEEHFQAVVEGLSSEKEEAKIGAAILLRTFLRPDYKQFYIQAFDLAVAHLRVARGSILPDADPDTPLPLTTLSQVLIVAFKEGFPLARSQNKGNRESLDATGIQLDNAFLNGADLKQVWMRQASLRKAKLRGANLSGAELLDANLSGAKLREANLSEADLIRANLSGAELLDTNLSRVKLREANLSGADLSGANLDDALSLKDANLRGVTGLTKEQLEACKAKGAIIDEAPTTSSSQPAVSPSLPRRL
jgi:Pentapeptide repeats (8 copies)